MPRSHVRPEVGSIVWYYATTPPGAQPFAAIVTKTIAENVFNVAWFDAVGVMTPALGVPMYYGSRPASGQWCTPVRVNEPAANAWPADRNPPLGPGGVALP